MKYQSESITKESIALDLSGGATDIEIFHAAGGNYVFLGWDRTYSEASSADAGVEIRIGRYQDGVALDDDYFDSVTSDTAQSLGYSAFRGPNDMTVIAIESGDTITVGTAGGKVGTGEVIVTLRLAKVR